MHSAVRLTSANGVARIELTRPEARNAMNTELCRSLLDVLDTVDSLVADGRVTVATLEGEGTAFCAGADLRERAAMTPAQASSSSQLIARCCDRIESLACPSLAIINGAALGGGLEMALACDLRFSSDVAELGFPETSYGFFPGAGGPLRLARLVGMSTATYLLMTGDRITGLRAERLGIVHGTFASMSVRQLGAAKAATLAQMPPTGIFALRKLLSSIERSDFEHGMSLARTLRDELNGAPNVQSAVQSFSR